MQALIEKEIALHQFHVRTDKVKVKELLHDSWQEVGESGNSYDLNSIIELMESEQPDGSKIHSQDYQSIKLSKTTILLLYKTVKVTEAGGLSHFAKRSSVWVLEDGEWKMHYHQGTSCEAFVLG